MSVPSHFISGEGKMARREKNEIVFKFTKIVRTRDERGRRKEEVSIVEIRRPVRRLMTPPLAPNHLGAERKKRLPPPAKRK